MPVGDRRIERVTVWRDAHFRQIRVSTAVQQEPYDLDMPPGGGILERRAGANVVRDVFRNAVGQRGILIEECFHSFQIADARSRANVDVRAPSTQVLEHLCGSGMPVLRHIAPAAKVVIAVAELNRPRAILSPGVDVRSARQQQVNHVELARHRRPVDRLIAAFIAGVQQLRRGIE